MNTHKPSNYSPNILWSIYTHRMLAEGVHYRDILDLKERIDRYGNWSATWAEFASAAEKRGDQALKAGLHRTGAAELTRASLYYFFSQFVDWHNPTVKRNSYKRAAEIFCRASPYLDPPQRRVEIPYRGETLPGYLRLPNQSTRSPLVILLGGLDTTKEEQLVISDLCVQRGLATLSFDGPGQGETYYKMKMTNEFEQALKAVLDFGESLEQIDKNRMGIIGRSMGGYYGPRIAALDGRIKAAVAWGAMFKLDPEILPELTTDGLMYVTGSKDRTELKRYLDTVDLSDVVSRIKCPLMIVHGGLDQITPTDNMTRMKEGVSGPVETLFWEDSVHCAHDRSHLCRPAMADFMMRHLAD